MFRSPTQAPFQNPISKEGAAAVDWWLSGGISEADVAGVWQPKGAASLSASYLRLAGNEGNANIDPAVVGGVAPTLSADGWGLNGTNQYLNTGIIVNSLSWSVIVSMTDGLTSGTRILFGSIVSGKRFAVIPYLSNNIFFENGGFVPVSLGITSGVVGFSETIGYLDGSPVATIPAGSGYSTIENYIGCWNNSGSPGNYWQGKIQAVAFYKVPITAGQFSAVTDAMNLL